MFSLSMGDDLNSSAQNVAGGEAWTEPLDRLQNIGRIWVSDGEFSLLHEDIQLQEKMHINPTRIEWHEILGRFGSSTLFRPATDS